MTTIGVVRHGETDWNLFGKLQGKTDIPLNSTGIRQAEECSHYLSKSTWDVIYTSPLLRAKKTAEIINQKLKIPVYELSHFAERCFGEAEGMEITLRHSTFPNKEYPNQENWDLFKKRVMEGISIILNNHENQRIILVAHGAVIDSMLSEVSNGFVRSGEAKLHNGCITTIYHLNGQWHVKEYNQISHLTQIKND